MAQATTAQRTLQTSNSNMAAIIARLQANLDAQFSDNSGAGAPQSPVKGMFWLDTTSATNHILKWYDGAGWLSIFLINPTTDAVQLGTDVTGIARLAADNTFAGIQTVAGLILTPLSANILQNTAAGSDNSQINISGAGSASSTRGALAILHGINHASRGGDIRLIPGAGAVNGITLEGTTNITTLSNLGALLAGLAVGTVGSLAFCRNGLASALTFGDTVSGASLRYASALGTPSGTPTGSWRCLGYAAANANGADSTALFQRTA